jgi:coenzyme F420-reducing hydrogenase gamma subunit
MPPAKRQPRLAVWKFVSCDGCQLTFLGYENALLKVAGAVEIAYFREATQSDVSGYYDLSLVDDSITTAEDAERIRDVRRRSRTLVAIGACATTGGIQGLRNFAAVREYAAAVYARPDYIRTLAASTAIVHHVPVDYELRGCPTSANCSR